MSSLVDFFSENNFLKKENPLQIRDIIEAQKDLLQSGFQPLPESFISVLKICNGAQSEGGALLGIAPNDISLNISNFNKEHNQSTQRIILGYDDFAFLVYDFARQCYLLLDRHDGLELDDFKQSELLSALISILHF